MSLWAHQQLGYDEVLAAVARGERRLLVTSPTGGGKTRLMAALIDHYLDAGKKVVLYTNRRLLVEQTSRVMSTQGIDHGVRAAGYADDDSVFPFQISSIQTEDARVYKKGSWRLHDADLAILDEAHLQKSSVAQRILQAHHEAGAVYVGFTATPIGIGELYETLIVAGNQSELRACGAIVPAIHYAPDEPDMAAWRRLRKLQLAEGKELSETQARMVMMTPGIWGRVWDNYERYNPEQRPTILFAPGVQESVWFAEQFTKKGVRAAHIDGQGVWLDGNADRTTKEARRQILAQSERGDIKVLCNRFVLREGIDAPWLSHAIFATVFGSLQSYLQAGGRLLRAAEGKISATISDHGGNWWRFGSLNENREWRLEWDAGTLQGLRDDRIRDGKRDQPFRCPECGRTWTWGTVCQVRHGGCGFELGLAKRSRPVVSVEGVLREMQGNVYRARRPYTAPNGPALWERMYWRSRTAKGERTFRAAMALFAYENHWGWPDKRWPFMPVNELDFWKHVADVPPDRLIPKESPHEDREEDHQAQDQG